MIFQIHTGVYFACDDNNDNNDDFNAIPYNNTNTQYNHKITLHSALYIIVVDNTGHQGS